MSLEIYRQAEESDLEELTAMHKLLAVHHVELNPQLYKYDKHSGAGFIKEVKQAIQDEDKILLVAEETEFQHPLLIGYIIGQIKEARYFMVADKAGRITDLFVREAHRKEGIATNLVTRVIGWFEQNGIKREDISLGVAYNNDGALTFFRKIGFSIEAQEMYLRK